MVLLTTARSPRHAKPYDQQLGPSTTGQRVGPSSYAIRRWGDPGQADGKSPGLGQEERSLPPGRPMPGPGAYALRRDASEPMLVGRVLKANPLGAGASAFRLRSSRISVDCLKEPLLVPG